MEASEHMRKYWIRSAFGLPMVSAVVVGPKGAARVELVFDSGAANTQLHVGTLRSVDFSFENRAPDISVRGVTGKQRGFTSHVERLHLFGRKYDQSTVTAFDFAN